LEALFENDKDVFNNMSGSFYMMPTKTSMLWASVD